MFNERNCMAKCDNCIHEDGSWECTNWNEFYIYNCELGLLCPLNDRENCEEFEEQKQDK